MDGLCRVIAAPVPLAAGAETLLVYPLTLRDLGILEHLLLSRRPDPFVRLESLWGVCGRIRDRLTELFREEAGCVRKDKSRRVIKRGPMQRWLDTGEGADWSAWLCLRHRDGSPRFQSVHEARGYFREQPDLENDFRRARDMASGLDVLSHLDWPETEAADGAELRYIPWKRIARTLAESYTFSPDQLGQLTLWNLAVYTCADESLGGVKSMSVADAQSQVPEAFSFQGQRQLRRAFLEGGE